MPRATNIKKLAKRITITAPASQVRTTAASKIQTAYRSRRPYKKKGLYKNVSQNTFTLKCKVPFEILYSDLHASNDSNGNPIDDSLWFSFVNAPWKNLQTNLHNRLYDSNFETVMPLYQKYRLARIDYHIRRPKQYVNQANNAGGDMLTMPTVPFGTQVLHTAVTNKADTTTNIIQSSTVLTPKIETIQPTSWNEAVDNQSTRFQIHYNKSFVKRTWLPVGFEKKARSRGVGTDQELACGGLHIRVKDKYIIENSAGTIPQPDQIMFEGFAVVYMNYLQRT